MFEVAASDPAALPDFFRWLTARIEAHAAALVAESVETCRTLAARGDRKEAQRAGALIPVETAAGDVAQVDFGYVG